MCTMIRTKEKDFDTIEALVNFLGGKSVVADPLYPDIDMFNCLCQIDIDATLKKYGIAFEIDEIDGDYYIPSKAEVFNSNNMPNAQDQADFAEDAA